MWGEEGADTFVFNDLIDSSVSNPDLLVMAATRWTSLDWAFNKFGRAGISFMATLPATRLRTSQSKLI